MFLLTTKATKNGQKQFLSSLMEEEAKRRADAQ
jgi:hypothetical protein